MPENKNNANIPQNGAASGDEFSLSELTDKYSIDGDVDLNSVESLFRELTSAASDAKEAQPEAKAEPAKASSSEIESVISEFEKNMPATGADYLNSDSVSDYKSPSAQPEKSNIEPVFLVDKKLTGIPVGKKSAGSRVIYSADDESPTPAKENSAKIEDNSGSAAESSDEKADTPVPSDNGGDIEDGLPGQKKFSESDMKLYEKERAKALGEKNETSRFKRFVNAVIPLKGDSKGEIVRKVILIVSFITIVVCAVWFGNYYYQHFDEKKKLTEIGKEVTTDPDTDIDKQWSEIKAQYPSVTFPDGMNIKYAKAYAANQDMVGKLIVPGTAIDIPIVQSKEDTPDYQYYLRHSYQKTDSKYGTPFLAYYCDSVNLSDNNVIHGHNMYDNLMFADLEKYYKLDGYKESPIIEYNTLYKDYKWKIFAVIITNGSSEGDNDYLFDFTVATFGDRQNKQEFIDGLLERSIFNTGVDVNADDTLLTLNTCCYVFNDARLGVVARLVRDGESADVDVSAATENENARYPQAWYDAKGIANPYKDAYRWHQTG